VRIISDSKYSINCVTEWYKGWQKKGWRTATGEDVKNRDLVEAIRVKIDERDKVKSKSIFQWVKGHNATEGNVAADELAVSGASKRRK